MLFSPRSPRLRVRRPIVCPLRGRELVGGSRRFKKRFVCGDISPSPRPSPLRGEGEVRMGCYCGVVVSGVVSIVPDDELFIVSGVVPGVRFVGQFIPLVPVVDVPECI